jgi:hypothetical protein
MQGKSKVSAGSDVANGAVFTNAYKGAISGAISYGVHIAAHFSEYGIRLCSALKLDLSGWPGLPARIARSALTPMQRIAGERLLRLRHLLDTKQR